MPFTEKFPPQEFVILKPLGTVKLTFQPLTALLELFRTTSSAEPHLFPPSSQVLPAFTSQEIPPEETLLDELDELDEDEELDGELEAADDELLCGFSGCCDDDELSTLEELAEPVSDELVPSDEYVLSPPTGAPPALYSPELSEADEPEFSETKLLEPFSPSLTVFPAQPVVNITAAKISAADFFSILFIISSRKSSLQVKNIYI